VVVPAITVWDVWPEVVIVMVMSNATVPDVPPLPLNVRDPDSWITAGEPDSDPVTVMVPLRMVTPESGVKLVKIKVSLIAARFEGGAETVMPVGRPDPAGLAEPSAEKAVEYFANAAEGAVEISGGGAGGVELVADWQPTKTIRLTSNAVAARRRDNFIISSWNTKTHITYFGLFPLYRRFILY